MRKLYTWLIALLAPAAVTAQRDSLPAFNSLRTPASPAFVLLGVEPTSVERPNTPSELGVSVISSTNQLTSLPRNFALEASPFWLAPHPTLTWRDDATRTIGQSILRTATLSVATAPRGSGPSAVTGLSLGARMSLVSGQMSGESRARLEQLETQLGILAKSLTLIMQGPRQQADSEFTAALKQSAGDTAKLGAAARRHEQAIALAAQAAAQDPRYAATKKQIDDEFQGVAVQREGLSVELAGGAVWDAPSQAFDSVRFRGWGAWLTPSYQGAQWSIVGVGRYLAVDTTGGFNTVDFGGRLIHTGRSLAVSAEYVDRHFLGSGAPPHQYRLAGEIEYQVREGVWVTGTFGRGYDTKTPGSLLAQLGVSFDFNRRRYTLP
jgi:hypothetical protein